MKIESVETILAEDKWLLVKVTTDDGIVGIGEAGLHGVPEAAEAAVNTFARYLVGKDPLRIEHHFQYLYRFSHFRGAAIMGALSAIDIALWDISGKHFEAPVYVLMGGKVRDKARVYMHVNGDTVEDLYANAKAAVDEGFTALRFTPFVENSQTQYYNQRYSAMIAEARQRVAAVREAGGNDIDVCVEIHRRLTIPEAIELGRAIEEFRPFFYEDPTTPDSNESMAEIARSINIPIATGERIHTIWEFRELLQLKAARYIRPDVCLAGGLTHCKKIAAVAESFSVGVIPHNPLTPISTAACVQLDACIPNFVLQEYTGEDKPPKSLMVKKPLRLEKGYLIIPEEPGIGVEINDEFFATHQYTPRPLNTPLRDDGSVADR
ncbi:MAG: galactonate dehydratase [Chloroflexi bacterium]|nr:galactonate dehydratase [Chloroflexota bacterium]